MEDIIEFPKWKYHRTKEAELVQDAAAEKALGRGWGDAPFAHDEPEEEGEK